MSNPLNNLIDNVELTELPQAIGIREHSGLYATHRGVVNIGGVDIEVFQLSDGQRVVTEDSVRVFLQLLTGETIDDVQLYLTQMIGGKAS